MYLIQIYHFYKQRQNVALIVQKMIFYSLRLKKKVYDDYILLDCWLRQSQIKSYTQLNPHMLYKHGLHFGQQSAKSFLGSIRETGIVPILANREMEKVNQSTLTWLRCCCCVKRWFGSIWCYNDQINNIM